MLKEGLYISNRTDQPNRRNLKISNVRKVYADLTFTLRSDKITNHKIDIIIPYLESNNYVFQEVTFNIWN